jgi:hypothetical protein
MQPKADSKSINLFQVKEIVLKSRIRFGQSQQENNKIQESKVKINSY